MSGMLGKDELVFSDYFVPRTQLAGFLVSFTDISQSAEALTRTNIEI